MKVFIKTILNIFDFFTQKKIIKPLNVETTSLGVAYLAGLQSGIIKNTFQINKLWKSNGSNDSNK